MNLARPNAKFQGIRLLKGCRVNIESYLHISEKDTYCTGKLPGKGLQKRINTKRESI